MSTVSKRLLAWLALFVPAVIVVRSVVVHAITPRLAGEPARQVGAEGNPGRAADDGPFPTPRKLAESRPGRARMIAGRVLDRSGIPVNHAKVGISLEYTLDFPDFTTASTFRANVAVDQDARFEVEVPAHGTYLVVAEAPGFAPGWRKRATPGDELELVLDVACELSGRVVRADSREPIANVHVDIAAPDPLFLHVERAAVTSASGSFKLQDLPAGKTVVRAQWAGHERWAETVSVGPGAAVELEVVLDPGNTVEGRVVDLENGRPLAGARVAADESATESGLDGAFRLEGVSAGHTSVFASALGWECRSATLIVGSEQSREPLVIALERASIFRGMIVDDDGMPVPSAKVYCRCTSTHTGPDGRFVATGPSQPGESFEVSAYCDGHLKGTGLLGADAGEVVIRLERCDQALCGVVRDSNGEPIADARVTCSTATTSVIGTDSRGAFRFEGCPRRSSVTIAAIAKGFAETRMQVDRGAGQGAEGVVLTLEASPEWDPVITGIVVDDSGNPVGDAEIRVSEGWGGTKGRARSAPNGRFVVQAHYPAGKDSVYVEASAEGFGGSGWSTPYLIEEPVTLTLKRLGLVAGRVVDAATGSPIPDATVYVHSSSSFFSRQTCSTSAAGEFKIAESPGPCRIDASVEEYAEDEPRVVEVVAGQTIDVGILALVRGGSIEGVVRAVTPGMSRREVVLASPGRTRFIWGAETDDPGSFRVDQVPPGDWEVLAGVAPIGHWSRTHRILTWWSIGMVRVTPGGVSRIEGRISEPAALDLTLTAASNESQAPLRKGPPEFTAPADSENDERASPGFELLIESLDGIPLAMSYDDVPSFAKALVSRWSGTALHTQFSMPIFAAGRYRLTLVGDGRDPVEATVAVGAGERRPAVLTLPGPR